MTKFDVTLSGSEESPVGLECRRFFTSPRSVQDENKKRLMVARILSKGL
jgi:hypothetical protein